jgi:hypothetical protein
MACRVPVRYGIQDLIVTARQIVARVRLEAMATGFFACLLVSPACEKRADLGSIGDGPASVLWRGTFEPGDLSEWTGDGEGGTYTQNASVKPSAISAMAHGGRYAGMVAIAPTASMVSTSYLFRNQPSPAAGYYSAWFYVPSSTTVGSWLSLTHFSGSQTGDGKNLFAIWDVNLYTLPGGGLAAQLYDYVNQVNLQQTNPVPVPLDTWVQIEVFLSKASDLSGEVAVWQGGALILQRSGVATVSNDWMQWDLGGASSDILPSPTYVYLDDAAISLIRLGPGS